MKFSKKNIAIVNRFFYPVTAGIETSLYETYRIFAKHGYAITVHTSRNTLDQKNVLKKNEIVKGIRVKRYTTWRSVFFPKIDFNKVDIVSIQNFTIMPNLYLLFVIWLKKILKQKKFVLLLETHGGFTPHWTELSQVSSIIKKLIHKTIGLFLINNTADTVRAVSEWEADELRKAGITEQLIRVIPNGIEEKAYQVKTKRISPETKKTVKSLGTYIVQIGRIKKIKNFETTIKALPSIPSDIRYAIIGPVEDKNYFQELQELAKKLHVQDRVVFLGVKKGYDKYYILKHALLMVHMAVWEAQSIAVLEGMSQGKTCIVSDHPALQMLIRNGEGGISVPVFSHRKLAKEIKQIYNNRDTAIIRKREIANAKFSANLTWPKTTSQLEHLYLTLAANERKSLLVSSVQYVFRLFL